MKSLYTGLAVIGTALIVASCSNIERSRNLGNPAVSGVTLAQQVCSTCHGLDGNSISPQFPKLASQQKEYLINQIKNFRGHDRTDPPGPEFMWGLSRHLTDAQVDEMAAYFNSKPIQGHVKISSAALEEGKSIFNQGLPKQEVPPCMACHGPSAEGMSSFPQLAGQHQEYLLTQMLVFQQTDFRPNTPMSQVTHKLTLEQMKSVANYLAAMPITP